MPAHCSLLMAEVPLSVSRSMSTSSAGIWKTLKCARRRMASRCSAVVILIGSTILILNGSMIVFMLFFVPTLHLPGNMRCSLADVIIGADPSVIEGSVNPFGLHLFPDVGGRVAESELPAQRVNAGGFSDQTGNIMLALAVGPDFQRLCGICFSPGGSRHVLWLLA